MKSFFNFCLGFAQKTLCIGFCVVMLGVYSFCGVAHASNQANATGQVTDLNGGPYSSITGTNMDGVCLLNLTKSGQLKLNENCRISAESSGSNVVGVRMINASPASPLIGVAITNSAIISAHNANGSATGFGVQNLGVTTWGNAFTIDGVKSEGDLGLAIGFSTGNINYGETPNTLFTTAQVSGQTPIAPGADLTIKNIESTEGYAFGIFANPKITIITNGGNIVVQNVLANGTGAAPSGYPNYTGSVGVLLDKGSKITTNRGNLTISKVFSAFDGVKQESGFYGSARGLALYNDSTLELINQGDTKSGMLTIDNVEAAGANSVAIGYDIHNATDRHQGPVVIRNVRATGSNGKAVAISVTADTGKTAKLTLGYGIYEGQEYLTGSNYGLEGDIVAAKGDDTATASIRMVLQGYSVLKGNLLTTDPTGIHSTAGVIDLHLLNGGVWYPVFDASNSATAEANTTVKLSENGYIDMAYTNLDTSVTYPVPSYGQRDFRTLTLNKLVADGGAFVVNTDVNAKKADKIVLNDVTDDAGKGVKVFVGYDPIMESIKDPGTIKVDLDNPIEIFKVNNGNLSNVEVVGYKFSKGARSYEIKSSLEENKAQNGNSWGLTSLSVSLLGLSPTAVATRSVAKAVGLSFINTTNTLQKRLGDLRNGAGSNIGWVRFMRTNNYMDDLKMNGNQYQVGYDRQISSDDISKRYFGVAIDQYDGNNSFESGNSDVKSTTLGVYYTRMFESGHYYDFIFRYGRTYGDWTSFDESLQNPITKADFGVNSVSISGEYGYRWNIGKAGFYIEPQVELIAGYVSSGSNRTSAGDLVYMDSARHFITRGGIAFGQRAKNFNYYLRFSYNHNFAGDLTVDYDGDSIKSESPKNWLDATLGLGWLMKDNCYLYGEVSKNYKDITNSLNFNVGFRVTL